MKIFIEDKKYDGIVIFSMSTYSNDGELEDDIISNFSHVFEKYHSFFYFAFFYNYSFPKIGFVWRINKIPENLHKENIKTVKWLPQRTIFGID